MKFSLPDTLPEWASVNANALLEPELSDKQDGFADEDYLPAKWVNWLLKNLADFSKKILSTKLGYWVQDTIAFAPATSGWNLHYNPFQRKWVFINNDESPFDNYAKYGPNLFGFVEEAYVNLPTIELKSRTLTHDNVTGRWLIGGLGGTTPNYTNMAYSPDGANWYRIFVGPDPAAETTVAAIAVKDDSDYLIVAVGYLLYHADSVTNAFTAAVTQPDTSGSLIRALKYVSGNSWICCDMEGRTFYSNDDGLNWYATATNPTSLTDWDGGYSYSIAVNPDTGTIVVTDREMRIAISNDGGTTWAYATVEYDGSEIDTYFYKIMYLGGGAWVIAGPTLTHADFAAPGLLLSIDNGLTWSLPIDAEDSYGQIIQDIDCDGKRIIGAGPGIGNVKMLSTLGRLP